MRNKVKVNRHSLNYFRKLARNTDKEIEAYLVGKVVSPEYTVIERFAYPKEYATQTNGEVQWYEEEVQALREEATKLGLSVVGTIHSHPNYWPILSATDHLSHVTYQMRLVGVCATMNRKTKVCFWVTESCLPCKVVYDDE